MRAIVWRSISSTGRPVVRARAASIWAIRSVARRPGARPLIRTGTISSTSDLMRPASPGRSRLEVVSPGIGSRAELDRMTRIAGSRPARRWGRAARSSRIALHSVPSMAACQAASSSSSKRPGGGPPELTTRRSRPPNAATPAPRPRAAGPSGVDRSAGTARASSRAAAAVESIARPCRSDRPWRPRRGASRRSRRRGRRCHRR